MVIIKKGPPPERLIAFQRREGAAYDSVDFPREDVYTALLKEQGGLCAYCMCRITAENIHIEHWVPQKGEFYADEYTQEECDKLTIDFRNMLGVCPGGRGLPPSKTTCDTHRQNAHIVVNPQRQLAIDSLKYGRDGTISSTDKQINDDISITLNLNEITLCANRKSAWNACLDTLQKQRRTGTWTKAMIDKQIAHYEQADENGNRPPYAGIVLFWLKKYRQRAT